SAYSSSPSPRSQLVMSIDIARTRSSPREARSHRKAPVVYNGIPAAALSRLRNFLIPRRRKDGMPVEFGFDLRQAGEIGAPIGFGMVVEARIREVLVAAAAAQQAA